MQALEHLPKQRLSQEREKAIKKAEDKAAKSGKPLVMPKFDEDKSIQIEEQYIDTFSVSADGTVEESKPMMILHDASRCVDAALESLPAKLNSNEVTTTMHLLGSLSLEFIFSKSLTMSKGSKLQWWSDVRAALQKRVISVGESRTVMQIINGSLFSEVSILNLVSDTFRNQL